LQTNNEEAIRFYQRFGFELGETIAGYYKRLDPPDAVLLTKDLRASSAAAGPHTNGSAS
jgi:ribosomal protein S18 acetylase RimI-like enzyme